MANYDGRLKHVHDTDIYYADGVSISTTTSWISDVADLGAKQAFVNIPVQIFWEFSANYSLLSRCTSINSVTRYEGMRQHLEIQDSSDGSTWAGSIIMIPLFDPVSAVSSTSIVSAADANLLNIGLCSIKRYSRLYIGHPTATSPSPTIKAWLRMGLTA
jgi:hypothetical protein